MHACDPFGTAAVIRFARMGFPLGVGAEAAFHRLVPRLGTTSARPLPSRTDTCEHGSMSHRRKLSPGYWLMLGALVVAAALWVSDLVFRWTSSWLLVAIMVIVLASNIFAFRMLWKQSDNRAFHRDGRSSDTKPPAAGESESRR